VDFPETALAGEAGVLAAVSAQFRAVVGAVVDADAVVVDSAPFRRQQFEVIVARQGDREGCSVVGPGRQPCAVAMSASVHDSLAV
jgi:hypothetical protein